jgi:hypothetical protein
LLRPPLLVEPALLLLRGTDLGRRAVRLTDSVASPRRRGAALGGALSVGGLRRDAKKHRQR